VNQNQHLQEAPATAWAWCWFNDVVQKTVRSLRHSVVTQARREISKLDVFEQRSRADPFLVAQRQLVTVAEERLQC
jgi:hypothetical protein